MSKEQLERQAAKADRLADETVDDEVRETLRAAAREYREKAKQADAPPQTAYEQTGRRSDGAGPI